MSAAVAPERPRRTLARFRSHLVEIFVDIPRALARNDLVADNRVDLDAAKEVALCLRRPEEQDNSARRDRHVNAVLNAREDGDQDTGKEDDYLEG